ncbi:hypothetical protein H4R34_005565 [Dimargaris verticillata]|uniref:VPS4-associated protein 1 n=1 Tax=Dimargaris verticillata TaxID=2761393 RepID=A0A9W8EB47_9FUNG|nr:hypothetical protein H4R34_005565 [Dimargaris verticillata]
MAPVPFANDYRLRTAVFDGACFICHKFTPVVLISSAEGTAQTKDWFHFCPHHAQDAAICRCLNSPTTPPSQPPKITDSKASPTLPKAPNNPGKDSGEQPLTPNSPSTTDAPAEKAATTSPQSTPAASAQPRRYALHRSLFYLRESQYQQKIEQRKLHELTRAFPATPTSRP